MFNALIQSGTESGGGMPAANLGVSLVLTVVFIASNWRVFSKAGEPGWAAIVPIYNILVLLRIAGKPAWWIILLIILLSKANRTATNRSTSTISHHHRTIKDAFWSTQHQVTHLKLHLSWISYARCDVSKISVDCSSCFGWRWERKV